MKSSVSHIASFTDESAWQALKYGSKGAFVYLYHKYIDILYDYGSKLTPAQDVVEDCIQELFADIWQKRKDFARVQSTKYYLLVALKRRIIRALASHKEYTFLSAYSFETVLSFQPGTLQQMPEERAQQLKKAFTKLTSKQKEAIYLRYYNQLSFEEIADIMDIQVKAAYKLLYRGLDVLRRHVPKETYLWSFLF